MLAELEDPAIDESSGLVASRLSPGIYWTHNDSGNKPYLYAFDRRGKGRGVWRVEGARARDWEDIAAGPGPIAGKPYLYLGDIGDNQRGREQIVVYRIIEPKIAPAGTLPGTSGLMSTEPAEEIRLRYPDGSHDAEALLVHPQTGVLYIVTKTAAEVAGIYKLAPPFSASGVNVLRRVGEVKVPALFGSLITGGDISPDGKRVILCDYFGGYELILPPHASASFDLIWKETPQVVDLGTRQQGEAVCYSLDGKSILATSEKRPTPLIEVSR
ncbi:MAG: hypothetical protein ACR2G4_07580 [Pyrinomonadaceae bacterium]